MDVPKPAGSFLVEVLAPVSKKVLNSYEGVGDEWRLKPSLGAFFMETSYVVNISDAMLAILGSSETRLVREVEGLCTIVKFGNTMQLRQPFQVVVTLER